MGCGVCLCGRVLNKTDAMNESETANNGSYRIHDKTDTFHWTKDYGPGRFERVFSLGDLVVSLDPQERLGEGTYAVSEITHGGRDLTQRGLFWNGDEAFRYAESLRNHRQQDTGTDQ